jgi:hypothetical protein
LEKKDVDAIVTARYCGQTQNMSGDRHVLDVYPSSLRTFLAQFMTTVNLLCRMVLVDVTVHIVEDTGVKFGPNASHINLLESLSIALFGNSVLDTQSGGSDVGILSEDDLRDY